MSDKKRLELSATQVIGGALAAASAAVAASLLGVYGTVIGAAVVSVLASVGGAVYTHSFHKGKQAIDKVRVNRTVCFSRVSGEEATESEEQAAAAADGEQVAAAEAGSSPGEGADTPVADRPSWRQRLAGINPKAVAITGACVLVFSLSGIVFAESLLGKPLSAALGGDDAEGGNSITRVFDDGSGGQRPEPLTSPEVTSSETPSATPTATVTTTRSPESDERSTARRPMDPATTSRPATSSSPSSSVKPTTSAPGGASTDSVDGEQ